MLGAWAGAFSGPAAKGRSMKMTVTGATGVFAPPVVTG
jgi:hypothetical protein